MDHNDISTRLYPVIVDGNTATTPRGNLLVAPTPAIAEHARRELSQRDRAQKPEQHSGVITRCLFTAIDHVGLDARHAQGEQRRHDIVQHYLAALHTDMLRFRDPQASEALLRAQSQLWDPLLAWFSEAYNGRLSITSTFHAEPIAPEISARVRETLMSWDAFRLVGLGALHAIAPSVIAILALFHGRIDGDELAQCAFLEEQFQRRPAGQEEELSAHLQDQQQNLKIISFLVEQA